MVEKISTVLNLLGLLISFVGTLIMFRANPKVNVNVSGTLASGSDLREKMESNPKKTKSFQRGMFILSIGFLVQLFGLVIPAFKVFCD